MIEYPHEPTRFRKIGLLWNVFWQERIAQTRPYTGIGRMPGFVLFSLARLYAGTDRPQRAFVRITTVGERGTYEKV